ncbi:hypothetical protein ACFOU0_00675 [Salinicoccus sesuvii]|uniref:Uncharacterized protein n=1 Tax=Salinicoccus sesuvii TaxID=868281 RepID=A0ABV7N0K6_9STAP
MERTFNFLEIHERKIVKALLYGFVIGLCLGILLHPGMYVRGADGTKVASGLTAFEYVMQLLRISIISSLLVTLLTMLYTRNKKNKTNNEL